jgi:hypothetical protein
MDEIARLKAELKQTQLALAMALQMSQFKAGFLARTSHELRSPLSSLISLHQLIVSGLCDSPEEEREFIAQAHQYALKLMGLIDQVVTVSKTEYGKIKLEIEPLQLQQVISEIVNLTHLQVANHSLRLEVVPIDETIYILADRERLRQTLIILIDTAVSQLQDGAIQLEVEPNLTTNLVGINLNIPCAANIWSETIDLLEQNPVVEVTPTVINYLSKTLEFSPGMKLLLAQNLIESMQGNLILLDLSSENNILTQIHCKLPLLPLETEEFL